MGNVISLPVAADVGRYGDRLLTRGEQWISREKHLLDQAEFLEAMILVLDDVRLQNIRNRDYAMMGIVSEEIPRYQKRLEEVQQSLTDLRRNYTSGDHCAAN